MLSMTSRCGDATEAMIVLGARLGGLIATAAGVAIALWVATGFVAVGMVLLAVSPFRSVRIEDAMLDDEAAAG